MELIRRQMPMDYVLCDTSDYHRGSINHHRDGLLQLIDKVARKKNYFLTNKGDSIEAILPNDKRYATCNVEFKENLLTPADQAESLIKDFMPIRKKIVAWGHGNHEYKLINTQDFGRYIAAQLGVPYGCVSYKFIATDKAGKIMHKFFMTHGSGSLPKGAKDPIQRMANRKAQLRRMLENTGHADCVVKSMGHTHQLLVVEPTVTDQLYLTDDGTRVKQHYNVRSAQDIDYIPPDSCWYVNTGSFLKLYTPPGSCAIGYGEIAMYGPAEMGWAEIHVQGGQVVHVEKVVV